MEKIKQWWDEFWMVLALMFVGIDWEDEDND
jgi:hypothetical protein